MGNSPSASQGNSGRPMPYRSPSVAEKLFQSVTDSEKTVVGSSGASIHGKKGVAVRSLVFWRNGLQFHIYEGQGDSKKAVKLSWLCRYDDPRCQIILRDMMYGLIPPNFADVQPGQPVEVRVLYQPKKEYSNGAVKMVGPSGNPGSKDEPFDLKAYLYRIGCGQLFRQLTRAPQQVVDGTCAKNPGKMVLMYMKGGSVKIAVTEQDVSVQAGSQTQELDVAIRHLIFYHNGFHLQLRKGETITFCDKFRLYDDPESVDLLKVFEQGIAPAGILGVRPGQRVEIRISVLPRDDFIALSTASPKTTLLRQGEGVPSQEGDHERSPHLHSETEKAADPGTSQANNLGEGHEGGAVAARPAEEGIASVSVEVQPITAEQEPFDLWAYLEHIGCSKFTTDIQRSSQSGEAQPLPETENVVYIKRLNAPENPTGPQSVLRADEEEVAVRRVIFWRNGFQFQDTGNEELDKKLNAYGDPENRMVLEDILNGTIPPELLGVEPGQAVQLIVTRKTEENFSIAEQDATSEDQAPQEQTE